MAGKQTLHNAIITPQRSNKPRTKWSELFCASCTTNRRPATLSGSKGQQAQRLCCFSVECAVIRLKAGLPDQQSVKYKRAGMLRSRCAAIVSSPRRVCPVRHKRQTHNFLHSRNTEKRQMRLYRVQYSSYDILTCCTSACVRRYVIALILVPDSTTRRFTSLYCGWQLKSHACSAHGSLVRLGWVRLGWVRLG